MILQVIVDSNNHKKNVNWISDMLLILCWCGSNIFTKSEIVTPWNNARSYIKMIGPIELRLHIHMIKKILWLSSPLSRVSGATCSREFSSCSNVPKTVYTSGRTIGTITWETHRYIVKLWTVPCEQRLSAVLTICLSKPICLVQVSITSNNMRCQVASLWSSVHCRLLPKVTAELVC